MDSLIFAAKRHPFVAVAVGLLALLVAFNQVCSAMRILVEWFS